MASAGRILIIPRGDYDANSTYEKLDLVKYKGTSWLAKKNATGVEPSEANAEYWQNMFDINIANNLTTEEEGYALDARQGKTLNDKITEVNTGLSERAVIKTISVSGNSSVTVRLTRGGVYQFSTNLDALDEACTCVLVYGGNGTNSSLEAKLTYLKQGSKVTYVVGNVEGSYNDVTISNLDIYPLSLSILLLNGLSVTVV